MERLKEKLSRHKKSTKTTTDSRSRLSDSSTSSVNSDRPNKATDVCEICERPGHDIFNCNLLKEEVRVPSTGIDTKKLFCQDCDSTGHATADCPHSLDVF